MRVLKMDVPIPVRYFIHYPQIIHTAFRAAVYPMTVNPARAFTPSPAIFLPDREPCTSPLMLIFSLNTCIVKGNRNSTSHA